MYRTGKKPFEDESSIFHVWLINLSFSGKIAMSQVMGLVMMMMR